MMTLGREHHLSPVKVLVAILATAAFCGPSRAAAPAVGPLPELVEVRRLHVEDAVAVAGVLDPAPH